MDCNCAGVTVNGERRERVVDAAQVIQAKLDVCRSDVLVKSRHLRRAGDRYDPRPLRQQPRERDLRRRRVLRRGERLQPLDEGEIRFPVLFAESRHEPRLPRRYQPTRLIGEEEETEGFTRRRKMVERSISV